jgi:hypothetical protein
MSRGWALGGDDFKANLQAEHDLPESGQSWDAGGRRELREAGWVPLVTGFNDEKLADFVGGSDELRAPLIVSIKDSLRAIETAYGGALEAARTDSCLGKVPAKSPPT